MATPSITGTPQGSNFTTSGTVVTYTGGGATGSNVYDVLFVNSDNVVTTPSGWTAALSVVNNQGSYIFTKAENGVTAATLALGGGIASPTDAIWVRVQNSSGVGITGNANANGSISNTTPAFTSSTLGSSTELALAFAALHGFTAGTPTATGWSTGYTEQANATNGTNAPAVYGSVAVKVPAGTAAESPTFSWTNSTTDRYVLFVTFSPSAGTTTTPNGIAVPVALGTPSTALTEAAAPTGIAVPVVLGTPTAMLNQSAAPTGIAVPVALGTPSVALSRSAAPTGIAIPVSLGTPGVGSAIGPTGLAIPVALGTPSVGLGISAAPSGVSVPVALGTPSVAPITTPAGLAVPVSLGSPSVSATISSAVPTGSWYGLSAVDEENKIYAQQEWSVTMPFCPNDGETLLMDPRTRRLRCPYDGFTR